MKFTVESTTENSVHVWDGESRVDKKPLEKHTTEYYVGRNHGFEPGDEIQIQIKKKEKP